MMKPLPIFMPFCVLLIGCSGTPRDIEERPEPPPHPIFTRSEAELEKAAGSIHFMGMQTASFIKPVIFSTFGYEPPAVLSGGAPLAGFGPGYDRIYVTPAEFKRVLEAIQPFAQKATSRIEDEILECAFLRPIDDRNESIKFYVLNADYVDFSQAIFDALDENNRGRNTIIDVHSCLASEGSKKRGAKFQWSTR